MKTVVDRLPEFGIELLSAALRAEEREWVPLMVTKYRRFKFASYDQAEEFVREMKALQPHVELRIAPLPER